MKKFTRGFALALVAAVTATTLNLHTVAAEGVNKIGGEAGIDFVEGETILKPGPDVELPEIKNGNLYFGKQEISANKKVYNSVSSHTDEERQYAGFVVEAGNANGWTVTAQITGFQMNGESTMKNFILEMTHGDVKTTNGNTGVAPTPETVKLYGSNNVEDLGDSVEIFKAIEGQGLGKWGCNWQGDLTVMGGSVDKEGTASATMLWTLNTGSVQA